MHLVLIELPYVLIDTLMINDVPVCICCEWHPYNCIGSQNIFSEWRPVSLHQIVIRLQWPLQGASQSAQFGIHCFSVHAKAKATGGVNRHPSVVASHPTNHAKL